MKDSTLTLKFKLVTDLTAPELEQAVEEARSAAERSLLQFSGQSGRYVREALSSGT
jgi:hypothetical protein